MAARIRPRLAGLCILFSAPAVFAADLTLRVEGAGAPSAKVPPAKVIVSLVEPCTSYECGRALLSQEALPHPSPVAYVEHFAGETGLLRVSPPEDRDAWWVVVQVEDDLPLALLWRPPAAHGHLPAVPRMPKAACRVVVLDELGNGVSLAHVVQAVSDPRSDVSTTRRERPALFSGWRPWRLPARTDHRGRATLDAPADESVALHVRAPGYRTAATACRPNAVATIRLDRVSTRNFLIQDPQGRPLPHALARDGLGMPLAMSNSQGKIDIDLATAEATSRNSAPLWFETANGALYTVAEEQSPDGAAALTVVERSSPRSGLVRLQTIGTETVGRLPDQAWTWREPNWPWPTVDPRASTPMVEIRNGDYEIRALPGERLWFAAPTAAHAVCESENQGASAADSGGDDPCPTLEPAPRIEGVVVDETGAAVPDAEIRVDWTLGRAGPTIIRDSSARRGFGTALMRSDQDGRFTGRHVPLDVGNYAGSNLFSERRVRVSRPPYLPVLNKGLEEFATDRGDYEVTLVRGARITGRVVDATTSDPVAEADVAIGQFAGRGSRSVVLGPLDIATGQYGRRVRTTRTESDGTFELTTWPGNQDLVVRAQGRAFHMVPDLAVLPPSQDLGDVALDPELQIRGIVTDQDGRPVPDATVRAAGSEVAGALSSPSTATGTRSAIAARFVTDLQGGFVVPGLPRGSTVDLEISAAGFATQHRPEVPPTESGSIEFALEPEAVIEGRVTLHGQGIATRVSVVDQTGSSTSWSTDEDGRFRASGLNRGQYNLVAYPPGAGTFTVVDESKGPPVENRYTLLSDGPGEETRLSVRAGSGQTVEVEMELALGTSRLFGRVSERGVGLAGVAIHLERRGTTTVTDADGRYSIDGLPSGLAWVTASRGSGLGGHSAILRKTVAIDSKSTRLDFNFSVFAVGGQAVLGDGSSASGIEISFSRVNDGSTYHKRTRSRGDGSFQLELPAGDYRVAATASGNPTFGDDSRTRRLEARDIVRVNGDMSDVVVRFRHGLRLKGRVHGLSEAELSRLRLEAIGQDLTLHEAEVIRGYPDRFFFRGLTSGQWTVIARVGNSNRRAERQVTLEDHDAETDLTFEPLLELSGVVTLDGQPLEGAHLLLFRGQDLASARRFWTRHDGSFRFSDVEPGSYTVAVGAIAQTVALRHDSHRTIDLRSGSIEGTAHAAVSGAPLAGASARLWPSWAKRHLAERFGIARTTFVDQHGRFAFDRLPEGGWNLEVEGAGETQHIGVAPGAVVRISTP